MKSFSFIIPSYNSRATISRTLRSILDQSAQETIREILVVDSSDDQETRAVIATVNSPLIRTICLNTKTPPAQGRNIGAAEAIGDVLCFIDSDVELAPVWAQKIQKAVRAGARLGGGGIAVPHDQQWSLLPLAQYYLQFNEFMPVGTRRIVPILPSCNMFCERDLFMTLGGFPDLRASEDVLFCLKAKELAPVWLVPKALCFHIFRTHWQSFLANQQILGKYILIYRRLYFKSWYYQQWWPVLFVSGFVVIKLARIVPRILKAGSKEIVSFLISLPVFLIGISAWAVGFVQGALETKNVHDENL